MCHTVKCLCVDCQLLHYVLGTTWYVTQWTFHGVLSHCHQLLLILVNWIIFSGANAFWFCLRCLCIAWPVTSATVAGSWLHDGPGSVCLFTLICIWTVWLALGHLERLCNIRGEESMKEVDGAEERESEQAKRLRQEQSHTGCLLPDESFTQSEAKRLRIMWTD